MKSKKTFGVFVALTSLALFAVKATPLTADDDAWNDLRQELFDTRTFDTTTAGYRMYVEGSAKDAALVPVSLRIPPALVDSTKKLHVFIDRNPAPVAAIFEFGDGYRDGIDIGERKIDLRIRIDSFSKVRAVFETDDGRLIMAAKFVAGAGGCSTVSSKDPDKALALLGRIRVKVKSQPALGDKWREATVMVRHPNFTGMQMDAKTGDYTPAWFVERIRVERSGKLMFSLQGGISISEDPNIRFTYAATGKGKPLTVTATDTKGSQFTGQSNPSGS
jgi:sulfur-oxidizing protein SoxY